MKHAGRLDQGALVDAVIERLRGHFQPTPAAIKVDFAVLCRDVPLAIFI